MLVGVAAPPAAKPTLTCMKTNRQLPTNAVILQTCLGQVTIPQDQHDCS